jgi:glycosyltransferase involved in cell wall biosynthesis
MEERAHNLSKLESLYKAVIHLIPPWIRRRVPRIINIFIKRWGPKGKADSLPIFDIGAPQEKISRPTKRALLSYITGPFKLSTDDPSNSQFSYTGIARSIVRVLNELGYVVDVVEWLDTVFVPKKKYDLFIGHGGCNFENIARNLPSHVIKIYFSTGIYWQEFNPREEERFRWLEKRRGIRLPYDRWIQYSEEYANESADGIICLGNQVAKDSYSKFPLVINLNNAAYHDDRYDRTKKDFASGRDKFLFFSGWGNVHKGLDLLLEAFAQVDAHLYICQAISPDFHKVYRQELEDFPNIHLMGHVPIRSPEFYELVDRCNFVILPSCAEGQPGSVVDCMHQGLIPVVSRESNIDTGDYGITLPNCSINEIVKAVNYLSQQSPDRCDKMSRQVRKVALTDFSESTFLKNMRHAIECVIARKVNASGLC